MKHAIYVPKFELVILKTIRIGLEKDLVFKADSHVSGNRIRPKRKWDHLLSTIIFQDCCH